MPGAVVPEKSDDSERGAVVPGAVVPEKSDGSLKRDAAWLA